MTSTMTIQKAKKRVQPQLVSALATGPGQPTGTTLLQPRPPIQSEEKAALLAKYAIETSSETTTVQLSQRKHGDEEEPTPQEKTAAFHRANFHPLKGPVTTALTIAKRHNIQIR